MDLQSCFSFWQIRHSHLFHPPQGISFRYRCWLLTFYFNIWQQNNFASHCLMIELAGECCKRPGRQQHIQGRCLKTPRRKCSHAWWRQHFWKHPGFHICWSSHPAETKAHGVHSIKVMCPGPSLLVTLWPLQLLSTRWSVGNLEGKWGDTHIHTHIYISLPLSLFFLLLIFWQLQTRRSLWILTLKWRRNPRKRRP